MLKLGDKDSRHVGKASMGMEGSYGVGMVDHNDMDIDQWVVRHVTRYSMLAKQPGEEQLEPWEAARGPRGSFLVPRNVAER